MFKNKYRIVVAQLPIEHYEVQIKRWWFPFWYQANFTNVNFTLEEAELFIERHKKSGNGTVVKTNL